MRLAFTGARAMAVCVATAFACGGSVDSGATSVASPVPRPTPDGECDLSKPFGTPQVVAVVDYLPSAVVRWVTLSPNEDHAYISVNTEAATSHIYFATRTTRDATFGKATLVDGLPTDQKQFGSLAYQVDASVSGDELALYFTVGTARGVTEIRWSSRASVSEAFDGAKMIPGFEADYQRGYEQLQYPFISADGQTLYYLTNLVDPDKPPVYAQRRWSGTEWKSEQVIGGGPGGRSADDLSVYVGTSVAHRASPDAVFGSFAPIAGLSGIQVTWVSRNECRVYGKRAPEPGAEVVMATRPR